MERPKLTADQFTTLFDFAFSPGYPGIPRTVEAPNGDGNTDDLKRYSHIAKKYLKKEASYGLFGDSDFAEVLLRECVRWSRGYAAQLGLAPDYWPSLEDSTIRVLHYPPGATSALHTDFDLFTVPLFRNLPGPLRNEIVYGELIQMLLPEIKALPHKVRPVSQHQYSAVFFAMPPLDARLPDGILVRDWLAERKARSRV